MVYGKGTKTSKNKSTGDNNTDALIANRRWKSRNVTFSFTSNFHNDYEDESDYDNSGTHASSFSTLNNTQRAVTRDWMEMYEGVSNLNLIELRGSNDRDATIRMAESNDPAPAYAYLPGGSVEAGDIWFNRNDFNTPQIGSHAFHTFGHEIGHALGLEHGHEKSGVKGIAMDTNRDSMEFSIMTYRSFIGDSTSNGYNNEFFGYAQSLMMYDISAIQQMYGANFNRNPGNTTYWFSQKTGQMFVNGIGQGTPGDNRVFRTIWDGNGNDTYDFSNYTKNLSIDLRPGKWNNLDRGGNFQRAKLGSNKYARGHVFNALQYKGDKRSLIENAHGGSGDDHMYGNEAHNYLRGNSGNDVLFGYAGNDVLHTNNGNDKAFGGDGNDYLSGWYGNDKLYGGNGNDIIWADDGHDIAYGGKGDDVIWGESSDSKLNQKFKGNDKLYGEDGEDEIHGGRGNDLVSGGNDNDKLYGNQGNDKLYGDNGNDIVYGHSGHDQLFGWYGNDKLYGGSGNDKIWADDGHDIVYGGSGNDVIWGETNNSKLNQQFKGGNDKLYGGSGNDEIHGGKGNDLLKGDGDNDKLYGDQGNDQIYGGSGNDKLYGWSGNDKLYGDSGDDTIWADDGSDVAYGGSGDDTIWGETSHAGLYKQFKGGNDKLYGESGNDKLHGGKGDDRLEGGTGHDKLYGDEGKDKLYGGSGNDVLSGGSGKDFMDGGSGIDTVDYRYWNGGGTYNLEKGKASFPNSYTEEIRNFENIKTGGGRDIITGNSVANRIQAGSGNDSLYGKGGDDRLYGEHGDDYLSGGSGNDRLSGSFGKDVLVGGSGDDSLYGGNDNDKLYGDSRFGLSIFGRGNDYLNGGSGNDSLYGRGGDDRLYGGSGNDRLLGSSGSDLLVGGTGDDILSGGSGADKFQFKSLREGTDRITDFARTQGDKLEILASGFGGGLVKGLLDVGQFVLGAASDTNDRFLYNRSTGALSFDIDGSGSKGAIQFATLSAGTTLTHNDIVVV